MFERVTDDPVQSIFFKKKIEQLILQIYPNLVSGMIFGITTILIALMDDKCQMLYKEDRECASIVVLDFCIPHYYQF